MTTVSPEYVEFARKRIARLEQELELLMTKPSVWYNTNDKLKRAITSKRVAIKRWQQIANRGEP